ncbi:MAG: hypothetical protein JXM70_04725 [Pirellulales bacterium]|nr:hypothetical protein [Pirellulales bacterium]
MTDIELFSLMSFNYLEVECWDAPPESMDTSVVHERYHISYIGNHAVVFCLECNGLFDSDTIKAVITQLSESERYQQDDYSAMCIINHEKYIAIKQRKVEKAIPDDVCKIAEQSGLTLITAPDLRFLIQGALEFRWDMEPIRNLLFSLGRQGLVPPSYREIGAYAHYYGRYSVMSIELQPNKTIKIGDTIGIRLAERYHEESVKSLQLNRNAISSATGPCRVGIQTILRRSDLAIGQAVFIRIEKGLNK